jgi:hypothetical protein
MAHAKQPWTKPEIRKLEVTPELLAAFLSNHSELARKTRREAKRKAAGS